MWPLAVMLVNVRDESAIAGALVVDAVSVGLAGFLASAECMTYFVSHISPSLWE
jgi:hypothetical protein